MSEKKQLPNMEELDDEQLDRAAGGFKLIFMDNAKYCNNCKKTTTYYGDESGRIICHECGKEY